MARWRGGEVAWGLSPRREASGLWLMLSVLGLAFGLGSSVLGPSFCPQSPQNLSPGS